MKKLLFIFIIILIMPALLYGCAGKEYNGLFETSSPPDDGSILPDAIETPFGEDDFIDIDLTMLSSTMVYGEVFQMMMEPERYTGKTIKMRGLYYASYYETTGQYYHFVVIQDATACCAQGLEFVWMGQHVYPDDYPVDGAEIEITGIWENYQEQGQSWYRIVTNSVNVV